MKVYKYKMYTLNSDSDKKKSVSTLRHALYFQAILENFKSAHR